LLLTERDKEADSEIGKAFENSADWPSDLGQQVYFLQVILALLNGSSQVEAMQNLRNELVLGHFWRAK
jgi:hypothetical protein